MGELFIWGGAMIAALFVAEAIYAFFFRDFGIVPFHLSFDLPGVEAQTVWSVYFDEKNAWNPISERLSYEVVSEAPLIVRICARWRGSGDAPITMDTHMEVTAPERSCRSSVIAVEGAAVPEKRQSSEVFEVTPTGLGTNVRVEARIPVKGWLRVPLHRRNLAHIYQHLRMACFRKADIPFRVETRRFWRRT
jgi:hypothetical protein